jgi:uncharacterized protein (DUF849 family)
VLETGANQLRIATSGALMGGNVRVGLEGSRGLGRGRLAQSNADEVGAVRQQLDALGLTIATPAEARDMLKLKG